MQSVTREQVDAGMGNETGGTGHKRRVASISTANKH